MNPRAKLILAGLAVFVAVVATKATAQTFTFTDPNVSYSVDFPNPTWRNTQKPDELRGQAEFVYGDRNEGYLQIRKDSVAADESPSAHASSDREDKLHFLPGYVDGKEERFVGALTGVVIEYEFTAAGKPMLGRIYYVQADPRTIYALRFTGYKDKLARIRNQTDAIARSFKLKS
jgi:hypothetical protein